METPTQQPEFAFVHLTRLCGCNYKQPIKRRGKSVIVDDPQIPGRTYRLDAAKFDGGRLEIRESWCIERFTEA